MADIRCPMCGKLNDAELEVCQFCQARLKPVWATNASEDGSSKGDSGSRKKNEDLPDWLRALRPDEEDEPSGSGEDEGDLPDWLSSLQEDLPASADDLSAQPEDETPDWLRGLRDDSRRLDPPAANLDTGGRDAANSFGQPSGEEDLPSWLIHADSDVDETPSPGSGAPQASDDDFVFDDAVQGEMDGGAGPAAEIPDWLEQGFGSEPGGPAEEDHPAVFAETTPDWLRGGWGSEPDETAGEDQLAGVGQPNEPETEIPGWLQSDETESRETVEASGFEEPETAPEEDLTPTGAPDISEQAAGEEFEAPDWLDVSPQEGLSGETPVAAENMDAGPEPELPEETGKDLGQDWLPEPLDQDLGWLDELAQEREAASAETSSELASGGSFDYPFGSSEDEGQEAAGGSMIFDDDDTEDLRPLEPGIMPGWLSGNRAEGGSYKPTGVHAELQDESHEPAETEATPQAGAATPGPGEEGLEQADLPNWLQAMRPVDTSMAAELSRPEKEVEGAGPLAGIHGVLPAEPDAAQVRKPAAASYKLQVSEAQQAQADLFRQLISEEGMVAPLRKQREVSSQHLLRILIALALALAALVPLFYQGLDSALPAAPAGVQAARQIVSGLPNGSPVLVSIDYEPGWSSELDPAATILIRDVLARGASLSLISTAPTGPLQAERVMASVNAGNLQAGQPAGNYLNLGYIPGGAAGLSSFAQLPQLSVSGTLEGEDPWSQPQLQSVQALSDFGLVVVVTENPDDARAWIEQVQPALGETPLVMVVSAQAQPLVEPYFRATPQQVQGLVTGVLGGKQYNELAGAAGAGPVTWTSYSLVLWTAVVLLFLGGLLSAGSAWLSARKGRKNGEG